MFRTLILTACMFEVDGFMTPPRGPSVTKKFNNKANSIPSVGFVREAEKKHGRVALLAFPTLATIYALTGENPVPYLSNQPVSTQVEFFTGAALLESLSLARLGPNFSLKDELVPGNFPPLSLPNKPADDFEDAAGRVAMLATTAVLSYGFLNP